MEEVNAQEVIEDAFHIVEKMSPLATDGTWLEDITVAAGPHIKEWDIEQCHLWSDWPERTTHFPDTTNVDVGIDVVAIRRSDRQHIAIQCKSRQLNEHGKGEPITKDETDKFANASSNSEFWAERWIVTNGDTPLSSNAAAVLSMSVRPVKMVNISIDLQQQRQTFIREECSHCLPNPDSEPRIQTKSCMQEEVVAQSVRILREHAQTESGGLPRGQARGKIILPCGTGKTRISLRIIEELTPRGELSIVLCPSIALVAQIRREYLQQTTIGVRALAVCSDDTAANDPKKEGIRNTAKDPTADNSYVSADDVKGNVTTDVNEIAEWICQGEGGSDINVIFGTYQSGAKVSQALAMAAAEARVLVADEAHRTAGLRRKRTAKTDGISPEEQRIRDFTLCHDNDAFPATYRVYQTATPRIYDTSKTRSDKASDWIVRSMDDETVFGVELYRKSYVEAVRNGWLADYRIIALAINDPAAYAEANALASKTKSKGKNALTSANYLRGLAFALAMGGATQDKGNGEVVIKSCIAFMNTVDKSKNMAVDLQTQAVRDWIDKWLLDNRKEQLAANYTLEHLDATSNVSTRENAKLRLAEADEQEPHGIINVGIFGEGTDSPSLNAVAFLESRKSPIDVIQAVGRAMRTAPGKDFGYIICPILIPPNVDPEQWLSSSDMDDGWRELGQILLALRAHDQRIEDELADLLYLYIPEPPEIERTIVAVASGEEKRIQYRQHDGRPGQAQEAVERVLDGKSTLVKEFDPITEPEKSCPNDGQYSTSQNNVLLLGETKPAELQPQEPSLIVTGKKNGDGTIELRQDAVARNKPASDGTPGMVDIPKTKAKAKKMINNGDGIRLQTGDKKKTPGKTKEEKAEQSAMQMLLLSGMSDYGNAIKMNLLAKSGLNDNRILRDLNILESSVTEAAFHLRTDGLSTALDEHFGLDNLNPSTQKKQADGSTIATLLMMNAAMLHQRISEGRWLSGINPLAAIKNDTNVVRRMSREWARIMSHDFRPILEPALEAIYAIEETGKTGGLERALRHIAAEAERIAETYADMGADHAGPLFNRVMGNQASDGAYFTRPTAASIAARLTLDACGDVDWSDNRVWKDHKTVDLACGSGTLLAAMLTDMKRRAGARGASNDRLAELQKLAVEDTIKGLDINPVSLQLAASQLTTGNQEIRYRRMGLHLMPYGPHLHNPKRVSVGTLELLDQRAIIPRDSELGFADDKIGSQLTWSPSDDTELEDAVSAVKAARIVIMNPPFTNRAKMGEKFPKETQQKMRSRADAVEGFLVGADPSLMEFSDKNSIRPLFVALADHIHKVADGVVTMINPTIALSSTSGLKERQILAARFHIHTVLTCHHPGNINMSQQTNINESIVVMRRYPNGPKPPTRFIHLDRMPVNESEVEDLHNCLLECLQGQMSNGWGEVSHWPADRMEEGDWTPAIWRSPELAEAATTFANHSDLRTINDEPGLSVHATGRVLRGSFARAEHGTPGSFPILKSKGSEGQLVIRSTPDECWVPKKRDENERRRNGGSYPEADKILKKAGYLLITAGQDNSTARLTATAADAQYVGNGWMPVTGLSPEEAKAVSVFINSTAGRLQLMRNPGRKISFPTYSAAEAANVRIPNIKDAHIRQTLSDCWEHTKMMEVPQYRDGECEVRVLWDNAVCEAMGWAPEELVRLRELLNNEPHVRGLGYNQYADEIEDNNSTIDNQE
ncbi:MAG: hypothetical protein F4Y84_02315 [Caldilineaceae bacterium SB0665_bin_25]|nr:hypothetical protein [Caldilineaceae bacterium SB0665_bin_25]